MQSSITLLRGGDELFPVGKTSHTRWVLGQHAGKSSATDRRVLEMVCVVAAGPALLSLLGPQGGSGVLHGGSQKCKYVSFM